MNIDVELDVQVYKKLLEIAAREHISLNLLIEKFLADLVAKKSIKYQCFENN